MRGSRHGYPYVGTREAAKTRRRSDADPLLREDGDRGDAGNAEEEDEGEVITDGMFRGAAPGRRRSAGCAGCSRRGGVGSEPVLGTDAQIGGAQLARLRGEAARADGGWRRRGPLPAQTHQRRAAGRPVGRTYLRL